MPCACFFLGVFFFFQAEDGIRDVAVTGVQTCALPICAIPPATRKTAPQNQPWLTIGVSHSRQAGSGYGGSRAPHSRERSPQVGPGLDRSSVHSSPRRTGIFPRATGKPACRLACL